VLIELKHSGTNARAINDTITQFLVNDHSIDASTSTWQASYVSRLDPDTVLGPVEDEVRPPTNAGGVRVELRFTFNTFFMSVLGQRTLTVGAASTSIYGPLGTAVGQDLAPLAISPSGWELLKRKGTVRLDMRGSIMSDYPYLPPGSELPPEVSDVITEADIAHVSFRDVAGEPTTGNDCLNPTLAENLSYWWCQGAPNQQRINRELPAGAPVWGRLNSAISWRKNNRPLTVLPIYAISLRFDHGTPVPYLQLVNFVAVNLLAYNETNGVLKVELIEDYATSGAMVGEGSGVETGVWAVNLKR
jgi:hypothetical protein